MKFIQIRLDLQKKSFEFVSVYTEEIMVKLKWVVSKYLTHFCYPIKLVLHQYLNSQVAYPGIQPGNSNHSRGQYQPLPSYLFSDYSDRSLTKLVLQKEDFRPVSYWSFT